MKINDPIRDSERIGLTVRKIIANVCGRVSVDTASVEEARQMNDSLIHCVRATCFLACALSGNLNVGF